MIWVIQTDVSGVTRPSDFVSNDISQNIPSTTTSSLVMNINNSLANTADIKNYVVHIKDIMVLV